MNRRGQAPFFVGATDFPRGPRFAHEKRCLTPSFTMESHFRRLNCYENHNYETTVEQIGHPPGEYASRTCFFSSGGG